MRKSLTSALNLNCSRLIFNLVPRGRDPFGQRRGFQRMTKGTPGHEVVDSVKLFVVVTSEVTIFVNGPWIATSCEMTMTGGETEWGGVG